MGIKISGGYKDEGVVVGNTYDKYNARNPIVQWLMAGFESALTYFVSRANPCSILEVGCGEGYWTIHWNKQGIDARGCDLSETVINMARENAANCGLPASLFEVKSVYEPDVMRDRADLIVCCEVLEHLDDPEAGLRALQSIVTHSLIISVPREPLWSLLNMARGKYILSKGNTPGHVQRWSKRRFIALVSNYFDVIEVKSPLPWTMLLCRPRRARCR